MFWVLSIECYEADADDISYILVESDAIGTNYEDGILKVYFNQNVYMNDINSMLINLGIADFHWTSLENQNWNEAWEQNFKPIQISENVRIRAPHHPKEDFEYDIIIQPNQAFGTGSHPTTSLMINAMSEINFSSKDVLDMGCGSGILSIYASLLGANRIVAIDYDILSVENSEINMQLNAIENVEILQSDHLRGIKTNFNIILSNIITAVNITFWEDFVKILSAGGFLIVSGILEEHQRRAFTLAQSLPLKHIKTYQEKEWICIIFQKESK